MSKSKKGPKRQRFAPPSEIELKFGLSEAVAETFVGWHPPGHTQVAVRRKHQLSTYFDTPGMHLRDAKVALRIRTVGDRIVQTVKAAGDPKAGGFSRPEWETDLRDPNPDLGAFAGERLPPVLEDPKVRASLCPVFTTDFVRQSWEVTCAESVIEIALDTGAVIAGNERHPIHEVEMELLSGPVDGLLACALDALEAAPFRLLRGSKAEAGYALLAGDALLVPEESAAPTALKPRQRASKVVLRLARAALAQMVASERVLLSQHDGGGALRGFRGGLRRLRSICGMASTKAETPFLSETMARLAWLDEETEPARDWEVLRDRVIKGLREAGGDTEARDAAALNAVARAAAELQQQAMARCRAALCDRVYAATHLWIERWLRDLETPDAADLEGHAKGLGRGVLDNRHKAVLSAPNESEAQAATIMLEDACDCFADLFPSKRRERYWAALRSVLDAYVAESHAARTLRCVKEIDQGNAAGEHLVRGSGLLTGWALAQRSQARDAAPGTRAAFAEQHPFWRKK